MIPKLLRCLELVVGRWEPPIAVAIARLVLGVAVPVGILVYGVSCILARQAPIPTRGGIAEAFGLPAVAVGIAYAALGLLVYVHVCWEEHLYLAGFRDVARQVLLVVVALSMAATFGLALI